MSSVLHPTGPEGPQTYWLRRIGVVVAALVVVLVVAWAWPGGGSSNEAAPASDPSSVSPPATDTTPTSTSTASGTATPTAGASTTSSSTTSPSSTTSSGRTGSKGDKNSTGDNDKTSKNDKGSKKGKKADSPTSEAPAVQDCQADKMHVTLTGTRSVTIAKKTVLKLSVINGSDETCRLSLDAKTFELRIYSGSDRIWSTHDCKDWMKPIKKRTLKSQQEVDWSQAWPAKRSYEGCKLVDDLRPGTYVATAQLTLDGEKAAPVQLVMSLHR